MQIKKIESTEEIATTFTLLQQIYENLSTKNYVENILKMMQEGYKMAASFDDLKCIAIVGFRYIHKLNYGKVIEIEDFVIDNDEAGESLLAWVKVQAKNSACKNIVGNLATKKQKAQRTFMQSGFVIDGFWFHMECLEKLPRSI